MSTRKATNLHLPAVLAQVASSYSEANGRNLSDLVAQLLREFLDKRGIPHEADILTVIEELRRRLPGDQTLVDRLGESGGKHSAAKKAAKKDQAARKRAA